MGKQTAIIERGGDERYSIYIENKSYPCGIIGTGVTVREAMDDFMAVYEEMKECAKNEGITFHEADFVFKYENNTPS